TRATNYGSAQALIGCSAYDTDDGPVLRVEDTGAGMSAADIALAGHCFRRGAAGRAQHGSGLGLAIVQTIADINNAHMEIVRATADGGLTVRLTFPQHSS